MSGHLCPMDTGTSTTGDCSEAPIPPEAIHFAAEILHNNLIRIILNGMGEQSRRSKKAKKPTFSPPPCFALMCEFCLGIDFSLFVRVVMRAASRSVRQMEKGCR